MNKSYIVVSVYLFIPRPSRLCPFTMPFSITKLSPNSSSSSILSLFPYILLLFIRSSSASAEVIVPEKVTVTALIVFGDSIVDQGNNNDLVTVAKCNYPPYGKDLKDGIPSGRFSNGKTPPDLLAEELGIKEFVPAYLDPNLQAEDLLTGVSFASGASGFDPLSAKLVSAFSLSDQVEMFKEYIGRLKELVGEEKTNTLLANSIYVVVTGSNDISNTYFILGLRRLQYDLNSYSDFLAQSASDFVKEIYKLGARRVVVFGYPPIGCLPSQRTIVGGIRRDCVEKFNRAAQLVNTKLSNTLSSLNSSLNDMNASVVYIDLYNPMLDIIQNGEKYGFAVVDSGCCGTGKLEVAFLCNKLSETCPDDSVYLFWDSFHPTEQGFRVLLNLTLHTYISKFV